MSSAPLPCLNTSTRADTESPMAFDPDLDRLRRTRATGVRIARRLLAPVILTAAIGSLLLAVPPLRGVATEIAHLRPGWILAAIALEVASCLAFVVIFRLYFDEVPPARRENWR